MTFTPIAPAIPTTVIDPDLAILVAFLNSELSRLDDMAKAAVAAGRLPDTFDVNHSLVLALIAPRFKAKIVFAPKVGNAMSLTVHGEFSLLKALVDHYQPQGHPVTTSNQFFRVEVPTSLGAEAIRRLNGLRWPANPAGPVTF